MCPNKDELILSWLDADSLLKIQSYRHFYAEPKLAFGKIVFEYPVMALRGREAMTFQPQFQSS